MTAKRFFLGLGVVCVTFTGTARPAEEPKRGAEEEQELQDAQVALAVARARQARVEGKSEVVIAECRKLLKHHEAALKAVHDRKGSVCSEEPFREAEGAVAVTRAWLAEAEHKREDLAAELPKVIAYHEWRIRWQKSLHNNGLTSDQDLEEEVKRSERELERARRRLIGLHSASSTPTPEKTEKSAVGIS